MPADRYWQFENARQPRHAETQPHDLRVFAHRVRDDLRNDWLVVPVDVDAPALTTIRAGGTRTRGERLRVDLQNDAGRRSLRMFRVKARRSFRG
jgi:hypothetical protein